MTDPVALLQLASEVEAGTGPDRDIDARIEDAIGPSSEYPGSHLLGGFTGGRKAWLLAFSPRYTASVDAALALLREVLTGWCYDMDDLGDTPCAHLYGPGSGEGQSQHGKAPTLPRAIVAASLRAVAARGEG